MSEIPIHVLLIDHDVNVQDRLRQFFLERGVRITVTRDTSLLAVRVRNERPTIVVLELTIPGVDGLNALRQLRANGNMIPVIAIASRTGYADRVVGLELGADDYIEKPFLPEELLARIRAVLRRQPPAQTQDERQTSCVFGSFELDLTRRTLSRNGEPVRLPPTEYALLAAFASNPVVTFSRERLLDYLHGTHSDVYERTIDVLVWRLRRLIEDDPTEPRWLQTVRGAGYVFVPEEPDNEDGDDPAYSTTIDSGCRLPP